MKEKASTGIIAANAAVLALAIVSYLNLSTVQPVSPMSDTVSQEKRPSFEWAGPPGPYELLIDDDPDFGSPLSFDVRGKGYALKEELDFGTYWWKVVGGGSESLPRRFTVVSAVALSRPAEGFVVNSGNTPLLVSRSSVTGAMTLAVGEALGTEEDDSVKAEQK